MKSYLQLLRVSHWTKNLFLFLPLFFSGHFIEGIDGVWKIALGFLCFSFTASVIYIINDIKDVEDDRLHPEKMKRPFASGKVKVRSGLIIAFFLLSFSFSLAYVLQPKFLIVLGIYFVLNLAYSLGLKHVSLLDITIIAVGFVLRVVAGGVIPDIFISQWILIMTFLLALFLGLAKRRDDVLIFMDSGKKMRKSVDGYNLEFINAGMVIMAAVTVVAYLMYTLSEDVKQRIGENLYLTSIFVILGVLRYLQIAFVHKNSGNPTKILLKDIFIQLVLAGFILSFAVLLYFNKR